MKSPARSNTRESGQVVVLFALLTFVIIALMGLAADVGRLYVVRAQLSRAVDAAALAGAKELPDVNRADASARAYLTANEADPKMSVTVNASAAAQQVQVQASRSVGTIFMRVFGISTVTVSNDATAGFGVTPVDTVLGIDATGSMGASPCTGSRNNSGCPIYEAKNAATSFVNTLLPSANTSVGAIAFRGCFNPPRNNSACVPTSGANSMIVALSNSASALNSRIGVIDSLGGTGTNVCGGLDEAASVLYGPGSHSQSNTQRVIVLLTDGDNTYNAAAYASGSSPVTACTPGTSPSSSDSYLSTGCSQPNNGSTSSSNPGSNSETRERQLDVETVSRAAALKAQKVEIYIVNFGVCGSDDNAKSTSSYCSVWSNSNPSGKIGNSDPDTVADQRLAKCMASSASGTNDHYFRVDQATQLPAIFTKIAQAIAFRLVK
ncbi:MAG: VWA domain-containing protein [Dehalococcoidia bacterium]|nr:VWA domain-containing protein [Dehalococcoidia bacterium]